jgi:ribose-phosphate pyrophosphokinase
MEPTGIYSIPLELIMDPKKMMNPDEVRFFCGRSNPQLAEKICLLNHVPLEKTEVKRFSNDDLYVQLGASVRKREVYIIQSLCPPVDQNLMELLLMLDIARSSGAKEVHAIIPYFSYARSDKKDAARISITGRLVADLLQTAGANHVMTMMLHSPQVHGFFRVQTDPLTSRPVFTEYFQGRNLARTIVVAPDIGAAKSAVRFAQGLGNLPVAAGNKERISDTTVRIKGLIGNQIKGHHTAIVYDDEIATGGSVAEISRLLVARGIQEIWVVCTHGVFVAEALKRLAAIPQITEIVATDTVYIPPQDDASRLRVVTVAPVFAEAIRLNYLGESISHLFAFGGAKGE